MMAFESLLPMALLAADAPAAWFPNNGVVGAVAGSSLGLVGGILGPLAGILAPRGLCRGFVMGTFVSLETLSSHRGWASFASELRSSSTSTGVRCTTP